MVNAKSTVKLGKSFFHVFLKSFPGPSLLSVYGRGLGKEGSVFGLIAKVNNIFVAQKTRTWHEESNSPIVIG